MLWFISDIGLVHGLEMTRIPFKYLSTAKYPHLQISSMGQEEGCKLLEFGSVAVGDSLERHFEIYNLSTVCFPPPCFFSHPIFRHQIFRCQIYSFSLRWAQHSVCPGWDVPLSWSLCSAVRFMRGRSLQIQCWKSPYASPHSQWTA